MVTRRPDGTYVGEPGGGSPLQGSLFNPQPGVPAQVFQNTRNPQPGAANPQGNVLGAAQLQAAIAAQAAAARAAHVNRVRGLLASLGMGDLLGDTSPPVQPNDTLGGWLKINPPGLSLGKAVIPNVPLTRGKAEQPGFQVGKAQIPEGTTLSPANSGAAEKFLSDSGFNMDNGLIVPWLQQQAGQEQWKQQLDKNLGKFVSDLQSGHPADFTTIFNPDESQQADERQRNQNSPQNLDRLEQNTDQAENLMAQSYRKAISKGKDQQGAYEAAKSDLNAAYGKDDSLAIQENMANRALQAQAAFDAKQAQYRKDNPSGILHDVGQIPGIKDIVGGVRGGINVLTHPKQDLKAVGSYFSDVFKGGTGKNNGIVGSTKNLEQTSVAYHPRSLIDVLSLAAPILKGAAVAKGLGEASDAATKAGVAATSIKTPTKVGNLIAPQYRPVSATARGASSSPGASRAINQLEGSFGGGGTEASSQIRRFEDVERAYLGNMDSLTRNMHKLSDTEFSNLFDVVEQGAKPINSRVARAVPEARAANQFALKGAKDTQFIATGRKNFMPHRGFDPETFKPGAAAYKNAVNQLVKDKIAKNENEAASMLSRGIGESQDTLKPFRAGSLEFHRQYDVPGYAKTKKAYFDYHTEAARAIAAREAFGPDFRGLNESIGKISNEISPEAAEKAKKLVETSLSLNRGQAGSSLARVSSGIRQVTSATHLQRAFALNPTQIENTAALFGYKNVAKAIKLATQKSSPEYQRAVRSGVGSGQQIERLLSESGVAGRAVRGVVAPGFGVEEKALRRVSHIAADLKAQELAKQAAKKLTPKSERELIRLGLNPSEVAAKGGRLGDAHLTQAGTRGVERTQFFLDPSRQAPWMTTPIGRLITQFRTFPYNQTAFIGRELLGEARHGNLAPAARYAASSSVAGPAAQAAQDALALKNPKDRYQKPGAWRAAALKAGGLGLPYDIPAQIAQDIKYGQNGADKVLNILGTTLGPAFSTAAQLGSDAFGAGNLGKDAARLIPLIGPAIANKKFPSGQVSSTKTSAVDNLLTNYDNLRQAGAAVGPNITLNDDEKKLASQKLVNANGSLKSQQQIEAELSHMKDGPDKQKLTILARRLSIVRTSATDTTVQTAQQRANESNNRFSSQVDAWKHGKELGNTTAKDQVSAELADFSGLQDQEKENYLRDMINGKIPRTFIGPDGQEVDRVNFLTDAFPRFRQLQSTMGGTPLTDVGNFKNINSSQKTLINAQNDPNVVDFSGLSDVDQRKFFAFDPRFQDPSTSTYPADFYQQMLINAGLVSPYTKTNQTYDPNKPIYSGKGTSRLGMNPNDAFAGFLGIKRVGGGSGGGGSRRGRKGGGRKGRGGSRGAKGKIPSATLKLGKPKKITGGKKKKTTGGGLAALFPGLL